MVFHPLSFIRKWHIAKKTFKFNSLRQKASETFQKVPDWRQQSKVAISIHDAMLSGLACMYFRILRYYSSKALTGRTTS